MPVAAPRPESLPTALVNLLPGMVVRARGRLSQLPWLKAESIDRMKAMEKLRLLF